VVHEFVQVAQCRLATKARAQFAMCRIAEDNAAKTITAMMCRPRQQRRHAAAMDRLETTLGREMHIAPEVNSHEYRAFALLAKQFRVCGRAARCHPPVDVARIVARLVGPRFVEFHATAAKTGYVCARLQGVDVQHVQRNGPRRTAQSNQPGLTDTDR
jgi:hypothetical protein